MTCQGRRTRTALVGLLLAAAGCESSPVRRASSFHPLRPQNVAVASEAVTSKGGARKGVASEGVDRDAVASQPLVSEFGGSAPSAPGPAAAEPKEIARVSGTAEVDAPAAEEVAAPAPLDLLPPPIGTFREEASAPGPLPLERVIDSVYRAFPEVAEAAAQRATARGEELAAWGSFDTVLEASSINQPLDYYENYRHAVGVTRPLWSGGAVSAGYRIGRGNFEPWYGNRDTNDGGEFMVGLEQPLLQGNRIDPRRVAVRTAALRRQAADPKLRAAVLGAEGAAARAYWGWVLAGFTVRVQRDLLALGRERVRRIETQIAAGELGKIAGIDNARLIAQRESAVIQAERGLQVAALDLSIYLRNAAGMPVVAPPEWLPEAFPKITPPRRELLRDGVARAPLDRPEPQALQLEAAALRVELAGAENQLLPQLDAAVEASQDVGGRSKAINDKQPFKLVAGVQGALPVQRRAGRGRIAAIEGRLSQNAAQRQLVSDRITAEAREAAARLVAAWEQIERAEANLQLANQAQSLGRVAFTEGDIDLLLLNIYEQSVADAQLQLYSAKAAYFAALAAFQVAIGEGISPEGESEPPLS